MSQFKPETLTKGPAETELTASVMSEESGTLTQKANTGSDQLSNTPSGNKDSSNSSFASCSSYEIRILNLLMEPNNPFCIHVNLSYIEFCCSLPQNDRKRKPLSKKQKAKAYKSFYVDVIPTAIESDVKFRIIYHFCGPKRREVSSKIHPNENAEVEVGEPLSSNIEELKSAMKAEESVTHVQKTVRVVSSTGAKYLVGVYCQDDNIIRHVVSAGLMVYLRKNTTKHSRSGKCQECGKKIENPRMFLLWKEDPIYKKSDKINLRRSSCFNIGSMDQSVVSQPEPKHRRCKSQDSPPF